MITVNNGDNSFTGTSGTIAWELEEQNVHLIVMWSVPYNLNIYNSYFGIGVVQLTTRFTRDMLPYWYIHGLPSLSIYVRKDLKQILIYYIIT